MQVKLIDENKEEFLLNLSPKEVTYFVEFALAELIKRGVLSIKHMNKEQLQLEYLKKVPIETLPKA